MSIWLAALFLNVGTLIIYVAGIVAQSTGLLWLFTPLLVLYALGFVFLALDAAVDALPTAWLERSGA